MTKTFSSAINDIKTGDIISFFSSHESSFLNKIAATAILYFTGSKIYHTGVAVWITTDTGYKELMLVEAITTGRRMVPLSYYRNLRMEVHQAPSTLNIPQVEKYLIKKLGNEGYGFWNLIAISLREFFGIKAKDTKRQVCSQLAAKSWQAGGVTLPELSVSPGRLRNILKKTHETFTIN